MNGRSPNGNFIGTGWAFPPAFTAGGADVVLVQDNQDIFESLQILLATSLGERVMREDYGCNLRDYLFEELDQRLLNNLRLAVSNAVQIHETRVEMEDVSFDIQADLQQSTIYIRIGYRVRTTNTRYNMVYPFYLTESALGPVGAPPPRSQRAVVPEVSFDPGTGGDGGGVQPGPMEFEAFLHRPTPDSTDNWVASRSLLDHKRLNENPDAIFFVTSLWGIENAGGPTLDAYEIGYLETEKRWAIFSKNPKAQMRSEDGIPNYFYVLIAPEAAIREKYAFVHRATAADIRNNATLIENEHSDRAPNAYLLATPRRSAHTNHEIGVAYFADSFDKWAIANNVVDGNASGNVENLMAAGSEFNVLVLPEKTLGNLYAFSHQANGNNIRDRGTFIDNELINGKQSAILFFTLAWRPEYTSSQGNHCPNHCQLWFDSLSDGYDIWENDRWLIWAPTSNVPPVTVFNVFVLQDI